MYQRPKRIVRGLAATLLALGTSVALASPALADTVTCGDLTFTSESALTDLVTEADGVVTVSGDADITVTLATPEEGTEVTPVTTVAIGGDEAAYTGAISFENIPAVASEGSTDPHPLSISVENSMEGTVDVKDCMIVGSETGSPAISVAEESNVTLNLTDSTITGAPGEDDATDPSLLAGDAGIVIAGESTIVVAGDTHVTGGAGGDCSAETGTPGAGGSGINAPNAELTMTSGTLSSVVGATGTGGDAEPTDLPVGLTVKALNLSNGTGTAGEGPTITAVGYPTAETPALPISGINAGTPGTDDFYPWLLQVSNSTDGSNPRAVDFAGSGNTQAIPRDATWRYLNIAPHELTGTTAAVLDAEGNPVTEVEPVATDPETPSEADPQYSVAVVPVFEDFDGTVESIAPATDVTITPEGSVVWIDEANGTFYVPADTEATELTVACMATLPESVTALYPELPATTEAKVTVAQSTPPTPPTQQLQAVYRLYNQWEHTHLYTTDTAEVDQCVKDGWTNENVYWYAPVAGTEQASYQIIRLYNPYNSGHYYVKESDTAQIDELLELGWERDSSASSFWSAAADSEYPVYTLFNPHNQVDTHLYTPYMTEVDELCGPDAWEEQTTVIWAAALPEAS